METLKYQNCYSVYRNADHLNKHGLCLQMKNDCAFQYSINAQGKSLEVVDIPSRLFCLCAITPESPLPGENIKSTRSKRHWM